MSLILTAQKRTDFFAAIYDQIRRAQGIVGGKVVFLEYERDRPKLLATYTTTHKFREFPMPSVEDKSGKLQTLPLLRTALMSGTMARVRVAAQRNTPCGGHSRERQITK